MPSRYLWRLARKVSGNGVRAREHWTAGRRLLSTWITKQSCMAISVTVSMRLPLRKRREDIAYAPCVAGVWPGRQSALHCSGAHECSTPGRQAELQICSTGAERPGKDKRSAAKGVRRKLETPPLAFSHKKPTYGQSRVVEFLWAL